MTEQNLHFKNIQYQNIKQEYLSEDIKKMLINKEFIVKDGNQLEENDVKQEAVEIVNENLLSDNSEIVFSEFEDENNENTNVKKHKSTTQEKFAQMFQNVPANIIPIYHDFAFLLLNKRSWNDYKKEEYKNKNAIKKGKFSKEETSILIKEIIRFSDRNDLTYENLLHTLLEKKTRTEHPIWPDVAFFIPNRSIKSICDYIHRLLSPFNNKGLWSDEEIKRLLDLYKEIGPRWKLIGDVLQRHPENVRDKWKNLCKIKSGDKKYDIEKPWTLSLTLKLLKNVNDFFLQTKGKGILKYGFKFNKMFKKGDFTGDRYLDIGEEVLFLDCRIKHFSQKKFVYDVFRLILDFTNLHEFILTEDDISKTIDFGHTVEKFNILLQMTPLDCKKKFDEILKYYNLSLESSFRKEYQFIEKVYKKITKKKILTKEQFDISQFKLIGKNKEKILNVINIYANVEGNNPISNFTSLSNIEEKLKYILDDILNNLEKSILYKSLIKIEDNSENQIIKENEVKKEIILNEYMPALGKKKERKYTPRSTRIDLEKYYNKFQELKSKKLGK